MLQEHADITIMIVLSLGLGNLAVTMLGLGFTRQMARLTKIPYPVLGFVIIPISFLAAFQNTTDISAIWIVLGGAVIGLLMKRYKWPRPPLLIGFILGPIIEDNILTSVGRYGWTGTFTRPLFIVLFIVAVATAIIFVRFIGAAGPSTAPVDAREGEAREGVTPPPAGGAPDAPSGLAQRMRGLRWRWSETQLFTVVLMGMMAYAIYEATSFSFYGRWFPMGLAMLGLTLTMIQFTTEGFGQKTGEIMDIGIRSRGMEGARMAGLLFLGLLALMMILTGTIGLKWGAVAVALVGPWVMMRNKTGIIGGMIGGTLILLLNVIFFDYLLAVFWPKPFILEWFR